MQWWGWRRNKPHLADDTRHHHNRLKRACDKYISIQVFNLHVSYTTNDKYVMESVRCLGPWETEWVLRFDKLEARLVDVAAVLVTERMGEANLNGWRR